MDTCETCERYKDCSKEYGTLICNVRPCCVYKPIISDDTKTTAGAHQVESIETNFDREMAAMTPKRLAKLYSKVIECLWCNCRNICREIGSTRNCAEVLENWLESEVTENEN